MWHTIYEFVLKFISGIGEFWDWLTTDFSFAGINFGIPPIFAIVGATAMVGLARRLI